VDPQGSAKALAQKLREKDILVIAISPSQIRLVTHLDISPEMVDRAVGIIEQL
jgi:threonine aldolase